MSITGMIFGGILGGVIYAAVPTILIVYLVAKLGSVVWKRRGFLIAGYTAAGFACIPFIYTAGFYLWQIATVGFKYPQYGDQFLGFYLLGGSLLCAVAALSTVQLSERVAHFCATRRHLDRPA